MSLIDALLLEPYPLELFLAYRTDGIRGSGTQADPFDASTAGRFDQIMAELPTDRAVRVHLGPSPLDSNGDPIPFETGGFWIKADGTTDAAWQPLPNMSMVGAGMDVTHLRLVPTSPQSNYRNRSKAKNPKEACRRILLDCARLPSLPSVRSPTRCLPKP